MNKKTDFCRQYQYLQLEKPSGDEVEIPVQKTMGMDLLKGGSYRTPPGSDRVKTFCRLQSVKMLLVIWLEIHTYECISFICPLFWDAQQYNDDVIAQESKYPRHPTNVDVAI